MNPPRAVLKLGGSLAEDPILPAWLESAEAAGGGVVVVPGGGPFAELIQASQLRWRFDDALALQLLLLGLQQYGRLMAGLAPRLSTFGSREELGRALRAAPAAVWLPQAVFSAGESAPVKPAPSADHLLAWLANCLQPPLVVLVKSCQLPEANDDLDALLDSGAVDGEAGALLRPLGCRVLALHKSEPWRLPAAVAG